MNNYSVKLLEVSMNFLAAVRQGLQSPEQIVSLILNYVVRAYSINNCTHSLSLLLQKSFTLTFISDFNATSQYSQVSILNLICNFSGYIMLWLGWWWNRMLMFSSKKFSFLSCVFTNTMKKHSSMIRLNTWDHNLVYLFHSLLFFFSLILTCHWLDFDSKTLLLHSSPFVLQFLVGWLK